VTMPAPLVQEPVALYDTSAGESPRLGIWRSPVTVIMISLSATSIGVAPAMGHLVLEVPRTAILQSKAQTEVFKTDAPSAVVPADVLRAIRVESGLTWEQLARVFGVSRRAIHHWAAGEKMSGHHIDLLGQLAKVVSDAPGTTASERRSALLLPGNDGVSALETFRARVLAGRALVNPPVATQAALFGAE
jgi:transcriptional regulator with XRE-family HTH domain